MPRKKPDVTTYTLYGLYHPTSGELRYIGQTQQVPRARLRGHIHSGKVQADKRPITNWVAKILRNGLEPVQKILYQTYSECEINRMEIATIRGLRKRGYRLANVVAGGNCPRGHSSSEEARRKTSETLKARYAQRPHHLKGKPISEEHRRKISEGGKRTKQVWTAERREQLAERNRQMWADSEKARIFTECRVASQMRNSNLKDKAYYDSLH